MLAVRLRHCHDTLVTQPFLDVSLCGEDREQQLLQKTAVIVAVQYVPDLESVCVVSSDGDILMCSVGGEVECVGCIDAGIRATQWSPDFELVVFLTGANRIASRPARDARASPLPFPESHAQATTPSSV